MSSAGGIGPPTGGSARPPHQREVTIVNRRGLHARAAARFVRVAEQFVADIQVVKDDLAVSGVSIMGLMMLAAAQGSTLRLLATGAEAVPALDALATLIADGFDED